MGSAALIKELSEAVASQSEKNAKALWRQGFNKTYKAVMEKPSLAGAYKKKLKSVFSTTLNREKLAGNTYWEGYCAGIAFGLMKRRMKEGPGEFEFFNIAMEMFELAGLQEDRRVNRLIKRAIKEGKLSCSSYMKFRERLEQVDKEFKAIFEKEFEKDVRAKFLEGYREGFDKGFTDPFIIISRYKNKPDRYSSDKVLQNPRLQGEILGVVFGMLRSKIRVVEKGLIQTPDGAPLQGQFGTAWDVIKRAGLHEHAYTRDIVRIRLRELIEKGKVSAAMLDRYQKDMIRLDDQLDKKIDELLAKDIKRQYKEGFKKGFSEFKDGLDNWVFKQVLNAAKKNTSTLRRDHFTTGRAVGAAYALMIYARNHPGQWADMYFRQALDLFEASRVTSGEKVQKFVLATMKRMDLDDITLKRVKKVFRL
jgi:hypothetical protein